MEDTSQCTLIDGLSSTEQNSYITKEIYPRKCILLRPRSNPASVITSRRRSRRSWSWRRRRIKLRLPHERERLGKRNRRTASSPLLTLQRRNSSSSRLSSLCSTRRRPEERWRRLRPRILQNLRVRRDVQQRLLPISPLGLQLLHGPALLGAQMKNHKIETTKVISLSSLLSRVSLAFAEPSIAATRLPHPCTPS